MVLWNTDDLRLFVSWCVNSLAGKNVFTMMAVYSTLITVSVSWIVSSGGLCVFGLIFLWLVKITKKHFACLLSDLLFSLLCALVLTLCTLYLCVQSSVYAPVQNFYHFISVINAIQQTRNNIPGWGHNGWL